MADTLNPLNPVTMAGPSPAGAFAGGPNAFTGMSYWRQEGDSAQLNQLAKQIQGLNLQQQLKQMQEWQNQAPTRAEEDLTKRNKAQVDRKFYERGQAADTSTKESDASLKSRTLDTKVEATNIENKVKHMEKAVEMLDATPPVKAGPGWKIEASRILEEMRLPPQIQQQLLGANSAAEFNQGVNRLKESIKNNIPQRRAIDMENLKQQHALELQKLKGQAAIAAAIAGRNPSDKRTVDQALAKNIEYLGELEKQAGSTASPQQAEAITAEIAQTRKTIQALQATKADQGFTEKESFTVDANGMPSSTKVRTPAGAAPQAGKYGAPPPGAVTRIK